jgi:hypothetical protein
MYSARSGKTLQKSSTVEMKSGFAWEINDPGEIKKKKAKHQFNIFFMMTIFFNAAFYACLTNFKQSISDRSLQPGNKSRYKNTHADECIMFIATSGKTKLKPFAPNIGSQQQIILTDTIKIQHFYH